jgi:hypothetical protein
MSKKRLHLKYVPLERAVLWDDNPKEHDIGSIIMSIQQHGFRDPPEFDAAIEAIVAGNGRVTALNRMYSDNEGPPLYCETDSKGRWLVPILFGGDSASIGAARKYAIDHNMLTLGTSSITQEHVEEMFRSYDIEKLFPEGTPEEDLPITISSEIIAHFHNVETDDIVLGHFEDSIAEGFADAAQFGVRIQLIVDLTKEQADSPGMKESLKHLGEKYGLQWKIKSRK